MAYPAQPTSQGVGGGHLRGRQRVASTLGAISSLRPLAPAKGRRQPPADPMGRPPPRQLVVPAELTYWGAEGGPLHGRQAVISTLGTSSAVSPRPVPTPGKASSATDPSLSATRQLALGVEPMHPGVTGHSPRLRHTAIWAWGVGWSTQAGRHADRRLRLSFAIPDCRYPTRALLHFFDPTR